jgi:hypothetical protein
MVSIHVRSEFGRQQGSAIGIRCQRPRRVKLGVRRDPCKVLVFSEVQVLTR